MTTRKGINISGHYVVSINARPFHICSLNSEKFKGWTESYFIPGIVLKTQRLSDTVFYVEFIPTAVSSN